MRGETTQWRDDKGFGFIAQDNSKENIFFHISSVKEQRNRPQVGDTVIFQAECDSQNRIKAKTVIIEGGVANTNNKQNSKKHIHTEPSKYSVLDYTLIFIFIISLAISVYMYFHIGDIEGAIPYAIPAIFSIILLKRQRKPKDKNYSCARCKQVTKHNKRSISAWNRGFVKLYCGSCHHKWLSKNSTHNTYTSNQKSGCLGVLALIVTMSIVVGTNVYSWLV